MFLNKTAHQMWHDYPFSQRNRTTERIVRVGVEGDSEWGRVGVYYTKYEKEGNQYRGLFIQ